MNTTVNAAGATTIKPNHIHHLDSCMNLVRTVVSGVALPHQVPLVARGLDLKQVSIKRLAGLEGKVEPSLSKFLKRYVGWASVPGACRIEMSAGATRFVCWA